MARRPRCSTGGPCRDALICALLAAAARDDAHEERRRVPHGGQVAGEKSVDDHGRERLGQRGEVLEDLGVERVRLDQAGVDGALQPGSEGRGEAAVAKHPIRVYGGLTRQAAKSQSLSRAVFTSSASGFPRSLRGRRGFYSAKQQELDGGDSWSASRPPGSRTTTTGRSSRWSRWRRAA